MANSTEVATKGTAEIEAANLEALEAELAAENADAIDSTDIQIPLLKIGQPLTTEVADGDASPGEFINALTREGLGREVTFIVSRIEKGRFDHGNRKENKRARKAYGVKNVPWSDDPFYGRPFADHPDAEEQYSKRVNNGDIEWGKGPRISTTYDFTGYVVSGLEEGEQPIPVCLSLMRMNSKAARKWVTILDAVLRRRYWDSLFALSTEQQRDGSNNYYTISVRQAGKPTQEQKLAAVALANDLRSKRVAVVGDADEAAPAAEPDAQGGMAV